MDNIEYGFDTLAALTGGAIVHRGIYEDPERDKLVAYTIVGGLKSPKKRIEELKKFFNLNKIVYYVLYEHDLENTLISSLFSTSLAQAQDIFPS